MPGPGRIALRWGYVILVAGLTVAEHSASWTYFTNYSHVIICLDQDPTARLRDVAARIGITERAVHAIVSDLEEAGVLVRHREGRRNRYEIRPDKPLRHPVEAHCTVRNLLEMVNGPGKRGSDDTPDGAGSEGRGRAAADLDDTEAEASDREGN
jgi:DNA-binding transcriptional ArsR family regulator